MVKVAIVGGGMSGISTAIQLKKQLGQQVDITIFEKEASLGGTWRNSTWPGAGVDIPIHLYSLYSDPNPNWNNIFASQKEVLDYLEATVVKNNLQDSFVFNTSYVSSEWSSTDQCHILTLHDSTTDLTFTHTTDILISANGPLSKPLLPKIKGIDTFKGISFHNLHWRKYGESIDFRNKKVAIIGNGSSGIQLMPGIANIEGVELVQYLRSGGYFFPKVNEEIGEFWKWVYRWVPGVRLYHRLRLFLLHNDRWDARNNETAADHDKTTKMLLDYLEQTAPREYLKALTPTYPLGCKRPAYDAGWLKALHLPNVTLNSSPILSITSESIINQDGSTFNPDVIIYATGSDVARHGVGLNVGLKGEGGVELKEFWEGVGGAQAYLGLAVPGFPNYFTVLGPNAVAGSWGYTIGNQSTVIARLVKEMIQYNISSLQPKRTTFEAHNTEIQQKLNFTTMNSSLCSSWWKIAGGGRLTVPNPLNAIDLWTSTRVTRWDDWVAIETILDQDGKSVQRVVDVKTKIFHRRARDAALLSTIVGIVGFCLTRVNLHSELLRLT